MESSPEKACIGVDIGGTNLRFALVGDDGAILRVERQLTAIARGRESFLARLQHGIFGIMECAAERGIKVDALGMGIPGLISAAGLIYSSVNLPQIEGLNLQEQVSRATGLPVIAVNDANAAAFGEKKFGAGREFASLLLLTLGTGVGSGLILDGILWSGIDGVAAEYGHATVEPEGCLCTCGNRGCLEQYASASALLAAAAKALDEGSHSLLGEVSRATLTAGLIAEAARAGDQLAGSLFVRAGRYLGIAAATAVNLLNLEAILLGGGVAASFDLLAGPMRSELQARAFAIPAGRVRIVKGALGDDAGLLGAAALAQRCVQTVVSSLSVK